MVSARAHKTDKEMEELRANVQDMERQLEGYSEVLHSTASTDGRPTGSPGEIVDEVDQLKMEVRKKASTGDVNAPSDDVWRLKDFWSAFRV